VTRKFVDRVALVIVLVGAGLLVASLVQGSDSKGRSDTAVRLVPPDALVYVNTRVEPDSSQWRRAGDIIDQLPVLRRLRDRALDSLSRGRRPLDFDTQLRPWIGDQAALALLPDGRRATSLILAQVADQAQARRFLTGAGRPREQPYRGVTVRVYGDIAAAFVGNFLAVGSAQNVRAAIDASHGASLARDKLFRDTVAELNVDERLAYAYATQRGVARVLRGREPLVDRLRTLVDDEGMRAAAAAAKPEPNGVRLGLASTRAPGPVAPKFKATLTREVPGGAIAYVGAAGIQGLVDTLERLGGGQGPQLPRVLERLGLPLDARARRALLTAARPFADREVALVVTPPVNLPVVSLLIGNTSAKQGGDLLVALQPVVSRLLESPSQGQVAAIVPRRIAGVQATTLSLSPSLQLTYAAFDDMVVITTSAAGIRQLRLHQSSLSENASFAPAGLRDFLSDASSVVFLDLRRLSVLVERAGLAATPGYRAIKSEITRIGAVSGVTASERSSQTAEIFVEVP
jgi:hypothetical protein